MFQAFADQICEPMILIPNKGHGQAAVHIASVIGQAQEVRGCLQANAIVPPGFNPFDQAHAHKSFVVSGGSLLSAV